MVKVEFIKNTEINKIVDIKEYSEEIAKSLISSGFAKSSNENINLQVKEFEKFYDVLMKNAPEGYSPWFFPCDKKGKNPSPMAILKIDSSSKGSWHHESARLNKEQVIDHIKRGYNIGLSARKDDALIIIDIDEEEYLDQIPKNTLTATSRKRAGAHAFGWDKDGTAKINLPTDFGELRCDNQYVLCCGSYVPFNKGNKKDKKAYDNLPNYAKEDNLIGFYTLRDNIPPKRISFDDLPQFFKDKHIENIEAEAIIKNNNESKSVDGEGKYSQLFKLKVSDIVGKIPSNKRTGHPLHESDTDANWSLSQDGSLGHCWRHLVSLNAVQYLCVKAGYKKCVDAGTPHKGRGISKMKGNKKAYEIAYKEALKMELIKKWEPTTTKRSEFLTFKGINAKTGREEYCVNIEKVTEHLMSKYNFKTIYGEKTERIKLYDGRIFSGGAKGLIKSLCENILKSYAKKNIVEEIFDKIKRKTKTTPEEFEKTDLYLIPVDNGCYNIKTKKLQPHSSDNNFTFYSPIKYNIKSKCPNWFKFINESLYPEDIQVMKQWFGFNLFRQYFIKKALILLGKKDTGKTVFLDILIYFIGEKNKCGLSLQKISSGSDFTKFALKNKLANIYDDLSSADINDGGAFKIATGGGYISAEEKFGECVQFKSYAKNSLAGNKAPPVKDNDDNAYFSRFLPVIFDNVPDKLDPFLRDKLQSEDEMSGILNWALEGLHEILKKGHFDFNKNDEEIKKIMEMSGDVLIQFGEDALEQSDGKITKESMYQIYCIWASENDKPILSKEQLGRRLNLKVKYLVAKNDSKKRFWDNVKFKIKWKLKSEKIFRERISKGDKTL